MTTVEKPLAELVQELPIELQSQVRTYVTQLMRHQESEAHQPLQLKWAGALRDLRDQTTSVNLQHNATGWIVEGALKHSANVSG